MSIIAAVVTAILISADMDAIPQYFNRRITIDKI